MVSRACWITYHVKQRHDRARVCHQMQCVEALCITDVGVSTPCHEEVHHVEVPIAAVSAQPHTSCVCTVNPPSSPLQRRSLEFSANSINVGSVVEQPPRRGDVRIDSCPVQRCNVLRVARVDVHFRVGRQHGIKRAHITLLCELVDCGLGDIVSCVSWKTRARVLGTGDVWSLGVTTTCSSAPITILRCKSTNA